MPIISALGRLRQEDDGFVCSLGYITRPRLKTQTKCNSSETRQTVTHIQLDTCDLGKEGVLVFPLKVFV